MQPLWKVLNFTSSFKYQGDIWDVVKEDDGVHKVLAKNERTGCVDPFNIYCLVEPVGIDMGAGQSA